MQSVTMQNALPSEVLNLYVEQRALRCPTRRAYKAHQREVVERVVPILADGPEVLCH